MPPSTLLPLRCQSCGLVPREKAAVCPMKDTRRAAGTTLVEQGSIPMEVVYLRRGRVALTARTAGGREASCAVRGPGGMVGLEGVLGRPMPYEVRALTDVTLCFNSTTQNTPPNAAARAPGSLRSGVLHVGPADTFRWECEVVNRRSVNLTFSDQAYDGEMCNVFGMYSAPTAPSPWVCTGI